MVDLSHWDFQDRFTAKEVAYLILGFDKTNELPGAFDWASEEKIGIVLQKIRSAYLDSIKYLFSLVAYDNQTLDKNEALKPSYIIGKNLPSVDVEEAEALYIDHDASIDFEGLQSKFEQQFFERKMIALWIMHHKLPSKYNFDIDSKAAEAIEELHRRHHEKPVSPRERSTLLNIIGVLLEKYVKKDEPLIDEIQQEYPSVPGLRPRTLQEKFAEARRSLKSN